jgi:branched-subunit amino acid ABC-type transport system permease component
MTDLIPFLVTGIVSGSLYGLAGVGLVLTYRTSGVFNFGHGALAAGSAYLFYTLHVTHGLPWPVAAGVTLVVFGVVVGAVLERLTRSLGDVPEAVVVVATVGLLLGIQGFLWLAYGNAIRQFPQFLPQSGFDISGVTVTYAQVISFVVATVSAFGLYTFLRRHRLGVAMRAVVDNPTLVALSAESPGRVRFTAWSIGSVFAALSGILLAPTLGLDAFLLTFLVVQAFGACAIGMFKSLPLTYLGGITVGVAASLATKYFSAPPFNGIPPAVPFLVLLVVLLAVPAARFPKRRSSLRSLIPEVKPMPRRTAALLAGASLVALAVVPAVVGAKLPVWTAGLHSLIIFASLALLVWTSGQISLCHAAFVAVGVTTMSHMTNGMNLPWGVALLLSGLITMPVGALVAVPAIRLSGLYLALATLGFGVLMQFVFFPTYFMFGQTLQVSAPRPKLAFLDATQDKAFYLVVLAIAVLCIAVMVAIATSRLGRLLRAMSETPTMLSTHGLGVNVTRLIVFCVSAFFAGIAGALAVAQYGTASTAPYGPVSSLLYVAVLAMCGTRLLRSSILAAALLSIVPGYLNSFDTNRQTFAFGVIAVAAAILIANRGVITEMVTKFNRSSRKTRQWANPPGVAVPRAAAGSRVPAGMVR